MMDQFDETLGVYRFPFDYKQQFGELGAFAKFDVVRERFYQFLKDKGLLEDGVELNLVGYSQGGMIILYAAGKYRSIRERMRRYVSIASPHAGAQAIGLLSFLQNLPLVTAVTAGFPVPLVILNTAVTGELVSDRRQFTSVRYPQAAGRALQEWDKADLLQICSRDDVVAYPASCRLFKSKMNFAEVGGDHLSVPRDPQVRRLVLEFLFGPISLHVSPSAALPGAEIRVSSSVGEFHSAYPVQLGSVSIDPELVAGELVFSLPELAAQETTLRPQLPEEGLLPVPFTVQPWLDEIRPAHATPGETMTVTGNFPEGTHQVLLNEQVVEAVWETNRFSFVMPEFDGQVNRVKLRMASGRESNVLTLVIHTLVGNLNTHELHLHDCPWVKHISAQHKVMLTGGLEQARELGLDNCYWCHRCHPEEIGESRR